MCAFRLAGPRESAPQRSKTRAGDGNADPGKVQEHEGRDNRKLCQPDVTARDVTIDRDGKPARGGWHRLCYRILREAIRDLS